MKKIILLIVLQAILFTSCRMTKSMVMMDAKDRAKLTEEQFFEGKHIAVDFLNFSPEPNKAAEAVWKWEYNRLKAIELENTKIAPVVYKSELDFRNVLTEDQMLKYIKLFKNGDYRLTRYFLSDDALIELKRIYSL